MVFTVNSADLFNFNSNEAEILTYVSISPTDQIELVILC